MFLHSASEKGRLAYASAAGISGVVFSRLTGPKVGERAEQWDF